MASLTRRLVCATGAAAVVWAGAGAERVAGAELPVVRVTGDNMVVRGSCTLVIEPGVVIADADGNGIVQVEGSDVVVRFAEGSVLRGGAVDAQPDGLSGVGIRVLPGSRNVRIEGARISGVKVGIWASEADGLVIDGAELRGLWRQRLWSTPEAEDQRDWLWPHENDAGEWRARYGAAVYLERLAGATVRRVVVREGQNGILLDRVSGSRVYGNDASFLSGWGVGLWRSSDNVVARNALDFCVRGYSHGVYNRGQDSAGILVFEQSSRNLIAENSATHSGDGLFGFAGKEALGERAGLQDHTRAGCNDNLIVGNDFSYAPAHGLEMTFSFGNIIWNNRLVENAICGIWGGYGQETVIANNTIHGNGLPGRQEGGGINIEHGFLNHISGNDFAGNTVGVSLWWDDDGPLLHTPWAKANHTGSSNNRIEANRFADQRPIALRATAGTRMGGNDFGEKAAEVEEEFGEVVNAMQPVVNVGLPDVAARLAELDGQPGGEARPVGARAKLRGREKIIMTRWGPWDHTGPLIRLKDAGGWYDGYEFFNPPAGTKVDIERGAGVSEEQVTGAMDAPETEGGPLGLRVLSRGAGVFPYTLVVEGKSETGAVVSERFARTLVNARWGVEFFALEGDPRTEAGKAAFEGAKVAATVQLPRLKLVFGQGGPSEVELGLVEDEAGAAAVKAAKLPRERFGTRARAVIPLGEGAWRISTLSDDGVRVRARVGGLAGGGEWVTVLENWTHHGPTRDSGVLRISAEQAAGGGDGRAAVEVLVEHFELDGYAVLEVGIEREGEGK